MLPPTFGPSTIDEEEGNEPQPPTKEPQPLPPPKESSFYMPHPGNYGAVGRKSSTSYTPGYDDEGKNSWQLRGYPKDYRLWPENYWAVRWDYKNPPVINGISRGPFGEQLPGGAQGWDERGRPYYGPGFKGWMTRFKTQIENYYANPKDPYVDISDAITSSYIPSLKGIKEGIEIATAGQGYGEVPDWDWQNPPKAPDTDIPLGPQLQPLPEGALGWNARGEPYYGPGIKGAWKEYSTKIAEPWQEPEEGEKAPNIGDKVSAFVGTAISATLDLAQELGVKGKQFVGTTANMLPYVDYWLSAGDFINFIPTNGSSWADYEFRNQFTLNPKYMLEGHLPFIRPGSIIDQEYLASRLLGTEFVVEYTREDFKRRYMNGEDPYLLQYEMENHWAEMAVEVVADPLNVFIGVGKASKYKKFMNQADEMHLGLDPAFDDVADMIDLSSEGRAAAGFANVIDAVVVAQKNVGMKINTWFNDLALQRGISAYTATGKRALVGDWVTDLFNTISYGARGDLDQIASNIDILYKLQGTEDEIAEALIGASKHSNMRMFLSKSGQMTGYVMRKIVGDKPEDFWSAFEKARLGGPDELIDDFIGGRVLGAIDDIFPTVTKRIISEDLVNAVNSGRKADQTMIDKSKRILSSPDKFLPEEVEWAQEVAKNLEAGKITKKTIAFVERELEEAREVYEAFGGIDAGTRHLDGFHRTAQKWVYKPFNTLFAGMYMGLRPQYAFRNWWNNTFTAFIDEGFEGLQGASIYKGKAGNEEATRALLGGQLPTSSSRTLGGGLMAGEEKLSVPLKIGDWEADIAIPFVGKEITLTIGGVAKTLTPGGWAKYFEEVQGAKLIYSAVKKTLGKLIRPETLPDIRPLMDAGLTDDAAYRLQRYIIEENYNVADAEQRLLKDIATGEIDITKTLSWIPDYMFKTWRDFDLDQTIRMKLGEADNLDDALSKIDEVQKATHEYISKVDGEIPMVEVGTPEFDFIYPLQEAGLTDDIVGEMTNRVNANAISNREHLLALQDSVQKVALLGRDNPEVQLFVGKNMAVTNPQTFLKPAFQDAYEHVMSNILPYTEKGSMTRIKKLSVDELQKIYDDIVSSRYVVPGGLKDARGVDEVSQIIEGVSTRAEGVAITSPKGLQQALWDNYWGPAMQEIWASYRDHLADDSEKFIDAANSFLPSHERLSEGIINKARQSLYNARLFDVDIQRARLSKIADELMARGDRKSAIAVDAASHGIASASEKGAALDEKLLNIINKHMSDDLRATLPDGKYTDLVDIPLNIADDIFAKYAQQADPEDLTAMAGKVKPRTPDSGAVLTGNRNMANSQDLLDKMFDDMRGLVGENWGKKELTLDSPELRTALKAWTDDAHSMVTEARLMAVETSNQVRDFALLDYRKKRGFDLAASYIYPFNYWYSRTIPNWMKRFMYEPYLLSGYAKYKDAMAGAHAGWPEWWKYNVKFTGFPGFELENPIFFNWEQLLNPLYGILGVDFNDPYKRTTFMGTMLDSIDDFGPVPWTPLYWIASMEAKARGDDEAARHLTSRIIPQTKDIKNWLSTFGVQTRTGEGFNELEEFYNPWFQHGQDPWDERMTAKITSMMELNEEYPTMQIAEVARTHGISRDQDVKNIWDEAMKRTNEYRATGGQTGVARYLVATLNTLATGLKGRTEADLEIMQFDMERSNIFAKRPYLSPDEIVEEYRNLYRGRTDRAILSIARGRTQDERDETYGYFVLSTIPPGSKDDVFKAFGEDVVGDKVYGLLNQFYDSKGEVLGTLNEADRSILMGAFLTIGTVLSLPDDATQGKWVEASAHITDVYDELEKRYGKFIHGWISDYAKNDYELEDKAIQQTVEDAMDWKDGQIVQNPDLLQYYGGVDLIERYFNDMVYDEIAKIMPNREEFFTQYNDELTIAQDKLIEYRAVNPLNDEYDLAIVEYRQAAEQWDAIMDPLRNAYYDFADQRDNQVNERLNDNYRTSGVDFEGEFLDAQAAGKLADFNKKYPGYQKREKQYKREGNDVIEAAMAEMFNGVNVWDLDGTGRGIFDNSIGMDQISHDMKNRGLWAAHDALEAYTATVMDPVRALEDDPQYEDVWELRDKVSEEKSKQMMEIYHTLKNPVFFLQPSSEWSSVGAGLYEDVIKPEKNVYTSSWKEKWSPQLTDVQERLMIDYFNGEEIPDNLMDHIDYIAGKEGINEYLLLELMKNSYYRDRQQ